MNEISLVYNFNIFRTAPLKLSSLFWKKHKFTGKLKYWSTQNEGFTLAEKMVFTQYRNLYTSEAFFKRRKTRDDMVRLNYFY